MTTMRPGQLWRLSRDIVFIISADEPYVRGDARRSVTQLVELMSMRSGKIRKRSFIHRITETLIETGDWELLEDADE